VRRINVVTENAQVRRTERGGLKVGWYATVPSRLRLPRLSAYQNRSEAFAALIPAVHD
jgi:hypothetical protein